MSKERLEEIQKEVNYAYRRDGNISTKAVTMPIEHYEHLYEQAERVQELEEARKTLSDNHFQQIEQHKYLLEQNKRYRELIKKMKRMVYDPDVDCGMICTEIIELEESE